MTDRPRLIEHAFPLKQASLDSIHEKNVRHGHISTLHIWPARRPLAACRAALIATLLPDPGTPEGRREFCEKIGGKVTKKIEREKMPDGGVVEREKEETIGGILHWGQETENAETLEWFRQEIRKAFGGRAPKVLDPFAGGGAIPLEAMRLGCETTAVDINPVSWFILRCTLEYPQKLAGKTYLLPEFILEDEDFMADFYKAHPNLIGRTKPTKRQLETQGLMLPGMALHRESNSRTPKAGLAWHVKAWGRWVLERARSELAAFYPVYADFEPIAGFAPQPYETQPPHPVPFGKDGKPDIHALNRIFNSKYLACGGNPRWVAKPTVAYLWARTATCKNCRATIPLLKTRWLCKKSNKRVLLTMEPNREKTGMIFDVKSDIPSKGGNATQKREHDKRIGAGTMSRSGAQCPCCRAIMTMEDLRLEGKSGRLGSTMTAVVVDGQKGKEYRLPEEREILAAAEAEKALDDVFAQIPFGLPEEATPKGGVGASRAFSVDGYGFDQWRKLYTPRQLLMLGTMIKWLRKGFLELESYPAELREATIAYLSILTDKIADYGSMVCTWHNSRELIGHTFARYALPITWDYAELASINDVGGALLAQLNWIFRFVNHALAASWNMPMPKTKNMSAQKETGLTFDAIVTDPPYYDAIPYSDLMDFFYVWLRRSLHGVSKEMDLAFSELQSPKWSHEDNDGELIDDASRHGNATAVSKQIYEDGMARVFERCAEALAPEGRLVIVFANKKPDAWETLVSAIIRAGFYVNASWPIRTEMGTRMRAHAAAALSSSVWLVCRKRPSDARPGWDNGVLEEMRANIREQLREFWDAGIRGPDFVWAATGPALEAYSRHPVVRKANEPGVMTVNEFLANVRRMVVDFVVGRVLSGNGDDDAPEGDSLDEPTAYYLLHRHDFGMDEAPAGACILYAISCGIPDRDLATTWDLIAFSGEKAANAENDVNPDDQTDDDASDDSGDRVKLKTWAQRKGKSMGYATPGGRPTPLIDRVHRLMHLWKSGDLLKVDSYLDENGLRRQDLFRRLVQSIIELSPRGSEERTLLESLSNHIGARGAAPGKQIGLYEPGEPV